MTRAKRTVVDRIPQPALLLGPAFGIFLILMLVNWIGGGLSDVGQWFAVGGTIGLLCGFATGVVRQRDGSF